VISGKINVISDKINVISDKNCGNGAQAIFYHPMSTCNFDEFAPPLPIRDKTHLGAVIFKTPICDRRYGEQKVTFSSIEAD
jgi:hypothetical protein